MTHPRKPLMLNYPSVVVKRGHANVEQNRTYKVARFLVYFLFCKPKFSESIASQGKGATVLERQWTNLCQDVNMKEWNIC